LGLLWVVQLFVDQYQEGPAEKLRWVSRFLIVDACVPEDKRHDLNEVLMEMNEGIWWEVGGGILGHLIGYAFTLGLGFVVHTLFISA
jgi:hypothetical protein